MISLDEIGEEEEPGFVDPGFGEVDTRLDGEIEMASIRQEMENLEKHETRALELYYIHGLTQTEIGSELGLGRKAISGILRRAETRLAHLARTG